MSHDALHALRLLILLSADVDSLLSVEELAADPGLAGLLVDAEALASDLLELESFDDAVAWARQWTDEIETAETIRALDEAVAEIERGEGAPAEDVLRRLRAKIAEELDQPGRGELVPGEGEAAGQHAGGPGPGCRPDGGQTARRGRRGR